MPLQIMHDDALLGILRHASWTKDRKENFKQQLYLLAVFQRLRAIALPKIYSHVYISSGTYESSKCLRYVNKYSKRYPEFINTNADIIALADCMHMVKSAKINIVTLHTPYAECYFSIEALKSCANIWPNITKFEMSMLYDSSSCYPNESHLMHLRHMDERYCRELAKIMPSVTELILLNDFVSLATGNFYILVADAYANQLVKLTSKYDCYETSEHKFGLMQHLYLNMDCNELLPRVNSHTLVDLNIDNIPDSASWAPFLDNKNDTIVEFSSLKKLRLEFVVNSVTEHGDANMPELLIKFPELSSLIIVCYIGVCPFFKMARFPNEIDNMYIQAPPALLAQLKAAGLPTATKVILRS